jgi:hypothetical protein
MNGGERPPVSPKNAILCQILGSRHHEERSDEAIQGSEEGLDCFVAFGSSQ